MMFGYYIVIELTGQKDGAGYYTQAKVKNRMNENILGVLYLPPHLREAQSNIKPGSVVVGYLDKTTGLGAAFVGLEDADFQYFYDADINIKKTLNVEKAVTMKDKLDVTKNIQSSTGDIKATSGDVKATTVSLKTHVHQVVSVSSADAAAIVAAAVPSSPPATTAMTTGAPM